MGKDRPVPTCEFKTETGRCSLEGGQVAQDMEQYKDSLGKYRLRVTREHFFCGLHIEPGTITLIDGTKVQHPAKDYREAKRWQNS